MTRRAGLWAGVVVAGMVLRGDRQSQGARSPRSPLAVSRRFGCYYRAPAGTYDFGRLEAQVGRRFDWYSTFMTFDSTPEAHPEIAEAAESHDVLVALMPVTSVGIQLGDILTGGYDAVLHRWFTTLAALPCQVVIRWAHEMNGSFMPYSPNYTGPAGSSCTGVAQFVEVWRYVVSLQRRIGGSNIRWLWNPSAGDVPHTGPAWLPLEEFYPGSAYVDIVGYDSYNGLAGTWSTALQTLAGEPHTGQASAYARVTALHPTAEVWVGETGCVEAGDPLDAPPVARGHSKAAYWDELFAISASQLPRLTTVSFFFSTGSRDWRIDTSPASLSAFRRGFAG